VLFVFALLGDCRTSFASAAIRGAVAWRGHRFLSSQSGTIAFEKILDIVVEAGSSGNGATGCRLILAVVRPQAQVGRAAVGPVRDETSIRSLLEN
jgi:hypothetical protein